MNLELFAMLARSNLNNFLSPFNIHLTVISLSKAWKIFIFYIFSSNFIGNPLSITITSTSSNYLYELVHYSLLVVLILFNIRYYWSKRTNDPKIGFFFKLSLPIIVINTFICISNFASFFQTLLWLIAIAPSSPISLSCKKSSSRWIHFKFFPIAVAPLSPILFADRLSCLRFLKA